MDFKEELQKLSLNGLKELGTWIDGAKNFTVEQAPLFVKEYATWYFVNNLVVAVGFFTVMFIFVYTYNYKGLYNRAEHNKTVSYRSGEDTLFFAHASKVVSFIMIIICLSWGFSYLRVASKGYFAPRLVVIEGIKEIVNSEKPCSVVTR